MNWFDCTCPYWHWGINGFAWYAPLCEYQRHDETGDESADKCSLCRKPNKEELKYADFFAKADTPMCLRLFLQLHVPIYCQKKCEKHGAGFKKFKTGYVPTRKLTCETDTSPLSYLSFDVLYVIFGFLDLYTVLRLRYMTSHLRNCINGFFSISDDGTCCRVIGQTKCYAHVPPVCNCKMDNNRQLCNELAVGSTGKCERHRNRCIYFPVAKLEDEWLAPLELPIVSLKTKFIVYRIEKALYPRDFLHVLTEEYSNLPISDKGSLCWAFVYIAKLMPERAKAIASFFGGKCSSGLRFTRSVRRYFLTYLARRNQHEALKLIIENSQEIALYCIQNIAVKNGYVEIIKLLQTNAKKFHITKRIDNKEILFDKKSKQCKL